MLLGHGQLIHIKFTAILCVNAQAGPIIRPKKLITCLLISVYESLVKSSCVLSIYEVSVHDTVGRHTKFSLNYYTSLQKHIIMHVYMSYSHLTRTSDSAMLHYGPQKYRSPTLCNVERCPILRMVMLSCFKVE